MKTYSDRSGMAAGVILYTIAERYIEDCIEERIKIAINVLGRSTSSTSYLVKDPLSLTKDCNQYFNIFRINQKGYEYKTSFLAFIVTKFLNICYYYFYLIYFSNMSLLVL